MKHQRTVNYISNQIGDNEKVDIREIHDLISIKYPKYVGSIQSTNAILKILKFKHYHGTVYKRRTELANDRRK